MADQTASLLRELPSIDRLLNHARGAALLSRYNHDYVTQKCRAALDQLRANIRQGKGQLLNDNAILDQVVAQIELESQPGHIRVVNATGTILHTNLGRALLSQVATRLHIPRRIQDACPRCNRLAVFRAAGKLLTSTRYVRNCI